MLLKDRLRELRTERNLLQKDIAKFLNLTTSAYGYYEQGKRVPDSDTVKFLADYFNVSLDYLLGNSDIKESAEKLLNNNSLNLTTKDKNDIQKDLKNIMDDFREQKDGSKYYNGVELKDEDFDYLELAMQVALEKIKVKNKDKYTPKKFRK
jgi:Predicted transcriptional regulators